MIKFFTSKATNVREGVCVGVVYRLFISRNKIHLPHLRFQLQSNIFKCNLSLLLRKIILNLTLFNFQFLTTLRHPNKLNKSGIKYLF